MHTLEILYKHRELLKDCQTYKDAHKKILDNGLATLKENDVKLYWASFSLLIKDILSLDVKLATANNNIQTLTTDNAKLREQLEIMQTTHSTVANDLATSNNNSQTLATDNNSLQNQLDELKATVEKLNQQFQQLLQTPKQIDMPTEATTHIPKRFRGWGVNINNGSIRIFKRNKDKILCKTVGTKWDAEKASRLIDSAEGKTDVIEQLPIIQ